MLTPEKKMERICYNDNELMMTYNDRYIFIYIY